MSRLLDTINEVLTESGQSPLPSPLQRYWKYGAGAAVAGLALLLWALGSSFLHPAIKPDPIIIANTPPPIPASVTQRARAHGGFLFPDSDKRFLGEADLKDLSAAELRVARNEIFARHGRFFKDQTLANYFSQYSWYQPGAVEVPLSPLESTNVDTIQALEHTK